MLYRSVISVDTMRTDYLSLDMMSLLLLIVSDGVSIIQQIIIPSVMIH